MDCCAVRLYPFHDSSSFCTLGDHASQDHGGSSKFCRPVQQKNEIRDKIVYSVDMHGY